MDKKCVILETLNDVKVLEHKRGADGLMRLEGTFGVCGVRNNNGRIYETKNYADMVAEMQQRIKNEGCPGELEHPNTMNITLENVSHKIESINIDENGKVTGTIVLLNTPKGQIAQAIVEGGLPLFISSRANGTVSSDGKVKLEHLQTYDLVGTPGFSQARLDLAKGQTFECLNESLGVIIDDRDTKVDESMNKDIYTKDIFKFERLKYRNQVMESTQYRDLLEKFEDLQQNYDKLNAAYKLIIESSKNDVEAITANDVRNIIKEEFAPAVEKWVVEEFAPEVQNWVVEEFAPEVQNWVVEEYTPMIDGWVTEEMKPSLIKQINENNVESKASKLDSIDSILGLLESRKDNKSTVVENKVEDPYASNYAVANMPEDVKPLWNMASKIVKESIVSKSKLYDFNKDGVLESFWENVDFAEPQAIVTEGVNKTITFGSEDYLRRSLRMTGKKLGLRD